MKILLIASLMVLVGTVQGQKNGGTKIQTTTTPATHTITTTTTTKVNTNALTAFRDTVTPGPSTMKLTTKIDNKMSAGFLAEGFVRQPNNQPIAGFTVAVDGSNYKVVTKNDGAFLLHIKKGDLLLFSKPGYVTVQMDPFTGPNFSSSLMRVTMTVTEQFYYAHEVNTATLNVFPIPCPTPSGVYTLDPALFNRLSTLGEVDDLLRSSLNNCRYDEKRWYCAPHGFALVTAMEQTSEEGVSLDPPARWSAVVVNEYNNPLKFFLALIRAPKGYFRVFVFLVTDASISLSGSGISENEARQWLGKGYTGLPNELRGSPLTPSHTFSLLVYQYKKEPGQTGEQIKELTAKEHFQQSHLAQYLSVNP